MLTFIGIIIFISIMENLFPDTEIKRAYGVLLGAYILLGAVSFIKTVDFDIIPQTAETEYLPGEDYGEELTTEYFTENIKEIIKERWGIEKDAVSVEVSVSEERKLKIKKIIINDGGKSGYRDIEATFGAPVEVQ